MTPILLQRGFQPGANPAPANPFNDPAVVALLIGASCLWLLVIATVLVVLVLVLVRSMQALAETSKRNRKMEPGMVWLSLVPLFGAVWLFLVVNRTADALDDEFDDRRLWGDGASGKAQGVPYAVLYAVTYAGGVLSLCFSPFACVAFVVAIAQAVLGVMYAAKLKAATQRLRGDGSRDDSDDGSAPRRKPRGVADDDFDDEPKPKRKPKLDGDGFEEYDQPRGGR